jgi:hypothetical protein
MTGWDILADIINNFPSGAAAILFAGAGVIFIVGFAKRGMNFIKYGFGQTSLDSSLEKRFDDLTASMDAKDSSLEKRFDDLTADMDAKDRLLEKRFDDLTARMATKEDIASLRTEFRSELAGKIGDLRTEVTGKIGDLRSELSGEIGDLRSELGGEIGGLRIELAAIKVNHFGHLKDFLSELTSILLDKEIITNQDKARLDSKLRGM